MAAEMKKETLPEISPQSVMLARQAFVELRNSNVTSVICPKCGKSPELYVTPGGEREILRCPCGYT